MSASCPVGLVLPIGEDASESNVYGSLAASEWTAVCRAVSGVCYVWFGEPSECVPPNGKSDSA